MTSRKLKTIIVATLGVTLTWLSIGKGVPAQHVMSGSQVSSGKLLFCSSPIIKRFDWAIRAFRPTNSLPASGELPFAPQGLKVLGPEWRFQHLLHTGERANLLLLNTLKPPIGQLGWTIRLSVSRMKATGGPEDIAYPVGPESVAQLESLNSWGSYLVRGPRIPRQGVYRADILFTRGVQTLGSYSGYFRAVRRILKVRLRLDKQKISAGAALRTRLENRGTLSVGYGQGFELARFDRGSWVTLPQHPFFGSRRVLSPGEAGLCDTVRVPRHARAGLYRVRKIFSLRNRAPFQSFVRTALFRVD